MYTKITIITKITKIAAKTSRSCHFVKDSGPSHETLTFYGENNCFSLQNLSKRSGTSTFKNNLSFYSLKLNRNVQCTLYNVQLSVAVGQRIKNTQTLITLFSTSSIIKDIIYNI